MVQTDYGPSASQPRHSTRQPSGGDRPKRQSPREGPQGASLALQARSPREAPKTSIGGDRAEMPIIGGWVSNQPRFF